MIKHHHDVIVLHRKTAHKRRTMYILFCSIYYEKWRCQRLRYEIKRIGVSFAVFLFLITNNPMSCIRRDNIIVTIDHNRYICRFYIQQLFTRFRFCILYTQSPCCSIGKLSTQLFPVETLCFISR